MSEFKKAGWLSACVAMAGLLLLSVVLYFDTVIYLFSIWTDFSVGEYGHGFLVVAISIYLIFINRSRLLKIRPAPAFIVSLVILLSSFCWLVATLVDVEVLQSFSLLLLLFSLVWAVTGYEAMRVLAFPVLFLIFAIPVWFPISPVLQDLTADVVFWIARVIEVPAFREENKIVVPGGIFSIEEACSGLRYFLASLTLGSLYAYLNYVSVGARVAVVMVSASIAVLANIIRVFIVVYAGYVTDMQHPWVHDHLMLGWYLFGGLVAVMLFLDTRLYRHSEAGPASNEVEDNNKTHSDSSDQLNFKFTLITILAVLALSSGPVIVHLKNNYLHTSDGNYELSLPELHNGWLGPMASNNDWMPHFSGSINDKRDYKKQSDVVSLYVGYYPWQKQGEEVINVTNQISNKKVWRPQYTRARDRQLFNYTIKEQLVQKGQSKRLIWYWYSIGGEVTTNKYKAKVLQLAAMLKMNPASYVVAMSVEVTDDIDVARKTLQEFASVAEKPVAGLRPVAIH